ncbi:MAG: OmpH family outer membrane protein [Bacteroidota bacterium]
MRITILLGLLVLTSVSVCAQQQKIGYANAEYILTLLPEAKQIEADLKAYETQLQNQLQAKYAEFQQKAGEYQQNAASMIDAVRADKEKELQDMQTQIQEFQQNAEQSLLKKRNDLLAPAVEKIANAIQQVAEANGFTHVFSAGAPGLDILLYASEDSNLDTMILTHLGIDPPSTTE